MSREVGLLVGGSLDGQELQFFGEPGDMLAYELHRGGGWEFMPVRDGMSLRAEHVEYYQWRPEPGDFVYEQSAIVREDATSGPVWRLRHGPVYFLVSPPENLAFNPALDPIESTIRLTGLALGVALTTQSERLPQPHHETVATAMRLLLRVDRSLRDQR